MRQRRSAFTLVELLVVIGIIALLISMLLPALNKARDHAKRVQCGANLRSIGQSLHLYANLFKGVVPVGNTDYGNFMTTYIIWGPAKPTASDYTALGLLIPSKCLTTPAVYYCPTGDVGFTQIPKTIPVGDTMRIGYGCRPAYVYANNYLMPTPVSPPHVVGKYSWEIDPAAPPDRPWKATKPVLTLWNFKEWGKEQPRLTKYKNAAIIADLFPNEGNVLRAHRNGINVLYGNGAVKWVPWDRWRQELDNAFGLWDPNNNIRQATIWNFLDAY